jgi:hypothetical protein
MQTWSDGPTWQTKAIAQSGGPFGLAPATYSDQAGTMDIGWTDGRAGSGTSVGTKADGPRQPRSILRPCLQSGPAPANFGAGSSLVACAELEPGDDGAFTILASATAPALINNADVLSSYLGR